MNTEQIEKIVLHDVLKLSAEPWYDTEKGKLIMPAMIH